MPHAFRCERCQRSFGTAIGRSQHERHAHPELRNQKRREAAEAPTRGPGRTPTVWTPEESALLIELNERFQGNYNINMKILEFLPGKTRKQISDKRAHLGLARTGARGVAIETHSGSQVATMSDVVVSEETNTLVQRQDDESASQEHILLDEWNEGLRRALAANCHNIGSFAGLEHKLAELTNNVRVENIDIVLCDFVSILKVDEDTRPPRPPSRHTKRRNHNALCRFRYAKCQEAYHKYPCKLVDMAIAGSKVFPPRVEPPEAGQIRV